MCSVIQTSNITSEEISKFDFAVHNAKFLFGKDLITYCNETRTILLEFRSVSTQIENNISRHRSDPNHSKLCDKECELISIITKKQSELSSIVEKYISFAEYNVK